MLWIILAKLFFSLGCLSVISGVVAALIASSRRHDAVDVWFFSTVALVAAALVAVAMHFTWGG